MKVFKLLSTIIPLFLLSSGCGMANTSIKDDLAALKGVLYGGQVINLRIAHVLYDTKTRMRVNAKTLEKLAQLKCDVPVTSVHAASLVAALDRADIREANGDFDLRWGLFFESESKQALHTIFLDGKYFTGTGRHGFIDGNPIKLNSNFVHLIEQIVLTSCELKNGVILN